MHLPVFQSLVSTVVGILFPSQLIVLFLALRARESLALPLFCSRVIPSFVASSFGNFLEVTIHLKFSSRAALASLLGTSYSLFGVRDSLDSASYPSCLFLSSGSIPLSWLLGEVSSPSI